MCCHKSIAAEMHQLCQQTLSLISLQDKLGSIPTQTYTLDTRLKQ